MTVVLTVVSALRLLGADYEFWSDSLFFGLISFYILLIHLRLPIMIL